MASNLIEAGAYLKTEKDAAACDLEILFAPLYSLERGLARPAEHFGFTLLAAAFVKETHIDAICHAENDESGSMRMEKALQAAPPSGSVVFGICETL